jgi:hypothetical protein
MHCQTECAGFAVGAADSGGLRARNELSALGSVHKQRLAAIGNSAISYRLSAIGTLDGPAFGPAFTAFGGSTQARVRFTP